MKALQLTGKCEFEYKDVPVPEFKADEVLIEVKACGICGSDFHAIDGSSGRRIPPIIMGHEASGVISQVGEAVDASLWKKGDRVTFDSTVYCGDCWYCRQGDVNLCEDRIVLGVSCGDYRRDGAFAEYVAVPSHILYSMPDDLSFEKAAMTEPVSVVVHAVNRTPMKLGANVVVVGAGMIGLLLIQALRAAGCGKIFAIDLESDRLELAKELGADIGILADSDDIPGQIIALTENRGADHTFEAVGITPTVNTAIKSVRKGGSVTLVGNLQPVVDFPLQEVVTRQISLIGSCASAGEYPECLDLVARGAIKVDRIISEVAKLEDGAEWFNKLYNKEKGLNKVILHP